LRESKEKSSRGIDRRESKEKQLGFVYVTINQWKESLVYAKGSWVGYIRNQKEKSEIDNDIQNVSQPIGYELGKSSGSPHRNTDTRYSHPFKFRVSRINFYKFSYFPKTIKEWNELPENVVISDSVEQSLTCRTESNKSNLNDFLMSA
jgi:hypothetical protein